MAGYDRFLTILAGVMFCICAVALVLSLSALFEDAMIRGVCDDTCSSLGYEYSTHYGTACDCADEPFERR